MDWFGHLYMEAPHSGIHLSKTWYRHDNPMTKFLHAETHVIWMRSIKFISSRNQNKLLGHLWISMNDCSPTSNPYRSHWKRRGLSTVKSLIEDAPNPKTQMLLESACSCLRATYWSQVLSGEWRRSWSSADRRCSNYIWLINNLNAYKGASYIRDLTVVLKLYWTLLMSGHRSSVTDNGFHRHTSKETWVEKYD